MAATGEGNRQIASRIASPYSTAAQRQADERKPAHSATKLIGGERRRMKPGRWSGIGKRSGEKSCSLREHGVSRITLTCRFLQLCARVFRLAMLYSLSETPASAKVAISARILQAASAKEMPSAAPVPSPRRKSRSTSGLSPSHSTIWL